MPVAIVLDMLGNLYQRQTIHGEIPTERMANCILIVCVIITLFLTASTIIQNAFGWTVTMQYTTISTLHLCNVIISGLCTIFTMYML